MGTQNSVEVSGIGTVYFSSGYMTWWAAKNWCSAIGKSMLKGSYLDCHKSGTSTAFTWTAEEVGLGCCCVGGGVTCDDTVDNQTSQMVSLRQIYDNYGKQFFWLADSFGSGEYTCMVYEVMLSAGRAHEDWRWNGNNALCK